MTTTSRLLGPDGAPIAHRELDDPMREVERDPLLNHYAAEMIDQGMPMGDLAAHLAWIVNERKTRDDRVPQTQRVAYRPRTPSGVLMTPDLALTVSSVWACLRFLSQSVAKLPWRVKRHQGKNSTIQETNPIDWILWKRASPEWSSFQFRETMQHWALRWGNGYAEIEKNVGGRPKYLHPIHPSRVTVMRDGVTQELYYQINGGMAGGQTTLDPGDIFHLRGFGEGPVGVSVMAYAAASLGWVKAAQLFGSAFFGHGAQLAGVVTMKKALSPEALQVLREDFQKLYGGPSKGGMTAFLDNEMDYKSIAVDPEKGQFIETNKFLLDEVCRWFGVPPHKIYNLDKATFSNIEHQSIEVVEDSLKPWVQRFQDEADHKLFGDNRTGLYSCMELKQILRADTTTRMSYYRDLRNIGAINVDEIREEEGLNGIGKKLGGDKHTMQSGMTTLEQIGELPAPALTPAPAASPPADPDRPGPDEGQDPNQQNEIDDRTQRRIWRVQDVLGITEEGESAADREQSREVRQPAAAAV